MNAPIKMFADRIFAAECRLSVGWQGALAAQQLLGLSPKRNASAKEFLGPRPTPGEADTPCT
jgi:hypothetical protein